MTHLADVVVVGGGPSGAAAASWLSRWGHDVVVVDRGRRRGPHAETDDGDSPLGTGQFLSPRAVQRLIEVGVDPLTRGWHRHQGVRLRLADRLVDVSWSSDGETARTSVGVRREVLARSLLARARDDGARVIQGHDVVSALVERGFVRGTMIRSLSDGTMKELRAQYVVVADGAGSTFGRALGTLRTANWPSLTNVQATWSSRGGHDQWIESQPGVVEPDGERLAAIVNVIPLGDDEVSIDLVVPSTSRQSASLNPAGLFEHVVQQLAPRWGLDLSAPRPRLRTERVPVGLSIRPHAGPTFLVIGTAVGAVNPFNGDGVAFGLETARSAAEVLHQALVGRDPTVLGTYSPSLEQHWGGFFKLGRFSLRVLGRPSAVGALTRLAGRTPGTTARATRFMTGLSDVATPADPAQRAALVLARSLPEA